MLSRTPRDWSGVNGSGLSWPAGPEPFGLAEADPPFSLRQAFRRKIERHLIIPMIIQQVGSPPSGADQIDAASNVSRAVPSGSVWFRLVGL